MKNLLQLAFLCLLAACATPDASNSPDLAGEKAVLRKIVDTERNNGDEVHSAELSQQIMWLSENNPDSFIDLAKTLKKQGHKQDALDVLQLGEKFEPENEVLQLEVGKALLENDRPDEAIAKLKSIKTLRNKDYYNTLGVAEDMSGDHKAAQAAFHAGLKVAPNDGLLLNNIALSYILEHNYQHAIKILKDLVKRPDAKPKYRQNLALAYGMIAKPDEARELLLKDMDKQKANENLQYYKELRQQQ